MEDAVNGEGRMTNGLHTSISRSGASEAWDVFGKKMPKAEIVFFSQILVIYTVVIACIVNISIGNSSELWVILLSTSVGAILPAPELKELKKKHTSIHSPHH